MKHIAKEFNLQRGMPNNVYTNFNTQLNNQLGVPNSRPLHASQQIFRTAIRQLAVRRYEPPWEHIRSNLQNVGWAVVKRGGNRY